MVAHHQTEAIATLHSVANQRGGDSVGIAMEVSVGADLVRCRLAVEAQMFEGQDVEIRLLLRPSLDHVGQNPIVSFAHRCSLELDEEPRPSRLSTGSSSFRLSLQNRHAHGGRVGTDRAATIVGQRDLRSLDLPLA